MSDAEYEVGSCPECGAAARFGFYTDAEGVRRLRVAALEHDFEDMVTRLEDRLVMVTHQRDLWHDIAGLHGSKMHAAGLTEPAGTVLVLLDLWQRGKNEHWTEATSLLSMRAEIDVRLMAVETADAEEQARLSALAHAEKGGV
ncbi:MAG TPA: hypothetical protein VM487_14210 [Phycisphaerae bacterium]|nr:hypothetical protein [Phycisphaerae bacterium]HUU96888.1 hypothetical protein [Phycisphaerae bacterium]